MNHVEEATPQMEDCEMGNDGDMEIADGLVPAPSTFESTPASDPSHSPEERLPTPENENTNVDDDDATGVATELATEVDLNEAMEDLDVDVDYEASESEYDSEEYEEKMDDADDDGDGESDWEDEKENAGDDDDYDPDNVPTKDRDNNGIEQAINDAHDGPKCPSSSHHDDDDDMEDLDYTEDADEASPEDEDEGDEGAGSDMDMSEDSKQEEEGDEEQQQEEEEESEDSEDSDEDYASVEPFPGCDYLELHGASPGVVLKLPPMERYGQYRMGKRRVVIEINTYDPPTLIRVPVMNLVLASKTFADIFGYRPRKGVHPSDREHFDENELINYKRLSYDYFNPAAMLWVLQALTHRWMLLPRHAQLALLKDIAVIVDRFQLRQAMEPLLAGWVEYTSVDPQVHVPSRKELVDWVLFITWVFRSNSGKDFRQATRGVIMNYTFKSKPKSGCLPAEMYKAIYQARMELYQGLANIVRNYLDALAASKHEDCQTHCGLHLMGTWRSILAVLEDPRKYKMSLSRIHQEIQTRVLAFEEVPGSPTPGCCESPAGILRACEEMMRQVLGIDCDGNPVRKIDECQPACSYRPRFNFGAVSWPCLEWLGCEADKMPCTKMGSEKWTLYT
ncbi:hypothetical protein AbraIFM66950_000298 [Aspergillus brasiliensis]|nr:hypothetical protein AbraIFM66950_000298 [Aspergillus brasiliensis]